MNDRDKLAIMREALALTIKAGQAYNELNTQDLRPSILELFDRLTNTLQYYTDDLEHRTGQE